VSILRTENLQTNYEKFTVFKDLNMEIKEGLVTTIIGPNGYGKSTLLKTIGRILKQKSGAYFYQVRIYIGSIRSRLPSCWRYSPKTRLHQPN